MGKTTVCHPENSKRFVCACGRADEWLHDVTTQACLGCQMVHARGPDGPKKEPKSCKGIGKRMRFQEAVWRAHEEFVRMMYRCGFKQRRDGRVGMNATRDGFTVKVTEFFSGDSSGGV